MFRVLGFRVEFSRYATHLGRRLRVLLEIAERCVSSRRLDAACFGFRV